MRETRPTSEFHQADVPQVQLSDQICGRRNRGVAFLLSVREYQARWIHVVTRLIHNPVGCS